MIRRQWRWMGQSSALWCRASTANMFAWLASSLVPKCCSCWCSFFFSLLIRDRFGGKCKQNEKQTWPEQSRKKTFSPLSRGIAINRVINTQALLMFRLCLYTLLLSTWANRQFGLLSIAVITVLVHLTHWIVQSLPTQKNKEQETKVKKTKS